MSEPRQGRLFVENSDSRQAQISTDEYEDCKTSSSR